MNKHCAVLVNSCDKYEATWKPFFYLLHIMWPNLDYPVYLNTESKTYTDNNLDVITLNSITKAGKKNWGKRVIDAIKRIDSEYVIFMLDDFWLTESVNQKRIDGLILAMDKNPDIAVFSFWRTHQPNIKDGLYAGFERRPTKAEYKFNCQAALWRKSILLKCLRGFETPWEWEVFGNVRSYRMKYAFYSAIEDYPRIMTYNALCGGAVHRGKWTPEAYHIAEQYGFELNDIINSNKKYLSEKGYRRLRIYRFVLRIKSQLRKIRSYI